MDGNQLNFSQSFSCPDCGISMEEIEPRSFSFNNPFGAARAVPAWLQDGIRRGSDDSGQGRIHRRRSHHRARLAVLHGQIELYKSRSRCAGRGVRFSLSTPFCEYPKKIHDILIYGTNGKSVKVHYRGQRGVGVYDVAFEGLIKNVERRYRETGSDSTKQEYETFMRVTPCQACHGQRLKPTSLGVTVGDKNIFEVTSLSIDNLQKFMQNLELSEQQLLIGKQILKEIRARVSFLADVGLNYLTLARGTASLSGGEAQRIRLATQIGSGLVGVAYILDEPSIGLHQRDNDKLLATLKHLRDLGNSLIVVEHDEDTMRAADCVVDIGPGAGEHGGDLVAIGTAEDLMKNPNSITGKYLSGELKIPVPSERRKPTGWLKVVGAKEHNLKNINVNFPLGVMTCVTGVSGSGKSSLVNEILYKRLARDLNRARTIPGAHKDIIGMEQLDKSSTSTSPRSEEHRVPIRQRTQVCLIRSATCLRQRRMPRRAATRREDSV